MKQSEIFYFDVDGTLLDNESHTVPQSTINALIDLQKKGYKVALCTGRSALGIIEAGVNELIDWDGYVLANGCLIMDKQRNIIHESVFDPKWIHTLTANHKGALLLEGDETFVTGEINDQFLTTIKHFNIPEMYPHRAYNNEKVYNIMSYDFDSLDEDYKNTLFEESQIVFDRLGNRELMTKDGGKHNGVRVLNKHLGLTHYAGFGDAANDIEFLRNARFAVAMGNGIEEVKQVAHYTTTHVLDDGIARALHHYGVLEEIR